MLQLLYRLYMDQTPKFYVEYEKALKKYETNKTQAIDNLKAALKDTPKDSQNDNWYNYLTIKIQLAGWMRDEYRLQESNAILTEVIMMMKSPSISVTIKSEDLKKVKFNAYQNFAKLLIQQADFDIKKQNYTDYRKKMTASFNYFRQAQNILLEMMNKRLKTIGSIKGEWIQWYMVYLGNINQLLLAEIQYFKDQTCMNSMVKIVKTAERIYQMYKGKEDIKEDIKSHLHRCYYNKGVALRINNKLDEALGLITKAYNVQKAAGKEEDAEKSRNQIMKILLAKNQLNKANSYYNKDTDQETFPINQIKARRQKIRKATSAPSHQIKLYNKQFIDELLADFNDKAAQFSRYNYDYLLMDQFGEKCLPLCGQNPVQKAVIYYYLAQANYHLQRYQKSYKMITEALKIPTQQMFDVRDNKIEKIQILAKWQPNRPEIQVLVDQVYKQINQELVNCKNDIILCDLLENQKQNLNAAKRLWIKIKSKSNDKVKYEFYNEEEQKLIQQLQKMRDDKKIRQANRHQAQSYSSVQAGNEKSKILPLFQPRQNQKIFVLLPQQEYSKKCKEKNVPQRIQIKNLLLNQSNFNPFQQMLNISSQQMQILLSIVKVQSLDLRNHLINQQLLQVLLRCPDFSTFKKFKLNGVGYMQNQTLAKVIMKMTQLVHLSFLDFGVHRPSSFNLLQMKNNPQRMDIENQKPRSIVHIVYLLGSNINLQIRQKLKVLKLKYCNILDNHLQEMQLQNYLHLKEVSLSHNLLQGKQLHRIFMLKEVLVVNLSDNPLNSIDYSRWRERQSQKEFVLKSVKLKNIKFQQDLRYQFKFAIYRIQMLDLSQSEQLPELFEQIYDRYCQSGLQFTFLTTLIMKNINLERVNLLNIFSAFWKLKEVDFRGCQYDCQTKKVIEQKKIDDLDLKIKISERQSQSFTFSKFKLDTSYKG